VECGVCSAGLWSTSCWQGVGVVTFATSSIDRAKIYSKEVVFDV